MVFCTGGLYNHVNSIKKENWKSKADSQTKKEAGSL